MLKVANNLLDAALAYHEQGYSVIPLQPGDKKPLTRWEEFSRRRASIEEIREWWRKTPNANVGLIMGQISNTIAVDIDTDRGGNAERVYEIAPTNLISRTGGGGYHLIYNYNNEIDRNKVGKNGVDIRSNGGYIVAPPSIHNNGKQYEWFKHGKAGTVTRQLIAYLKLPQLAPETEGENPKWLTNALLGVSDGSRNDTCAKLVGYYAGKGIPKDVTLMMLLNWDNLNQPPLGADRIQLTVESVYKTSYKYSPLPETTRAASTFNVMTMNGFMREFGAQAVSWIVPEWLPQGTIAFAVSPPGTYKTWMLLDLAISVASGTPFLNKYPIESQGPVLMIQQEDHHGGLAERLGVIMNARYNILPPIIDPGFTLNPPPDLPIYFHTDRSLKFNNKGMMDALEEQIERIRPKVVIIDPLYSAAETDDYMAKSAGEMFRLKELRDKYGCSFIIAHHKKKKADGNEREGLWGSQFLNAFLETGWQIRRTGDSTISVLRHFKVRKESTELTVNFDIDTEKYPYKYQMSIYDTDNEEEVDIEQYLAENGPKSIVELADELNIAKQTVSKIVTALSRDKLLVKTPDKKFKAVSAEDEF